MKRIIFGLVFLLFLFGTTQADFFGTFGTATEVDDTCRLYFETFDTLGHSANPVGDSVYVLRFVRGTLVDSTSATKLREYYWGITKKAYDGTNLGQYSVIAYWRPCVDKWYNDAGYYIVEPETVSYARGDTIQRDASTFDNTSDYVKISEGTGTGQLDLSSGKVKLAGITHTGATIPTVTSVTNDVNINSNADITDIKNQTDKLTFDGSNNIYSTPQTNVTVGTNNDKTGYSLTTDYITKSDSGSTGASYLRAKYIEDKTGYTVSTVQDKTGYALTSDYHTKADTTGDTSYLRTKQVDDKTGYSLTSDYPQKSDSTSFQAKGFLTKGDTASCQAKGFLTLSDLPTMADTFWLKDTTDYKDSSGTMGEYLVHKSGGGATAQEIWEYQGEITLQDTIPKVYAVNITAGTDPDSIANHVWTWSTRTLTTGCGTGANQVKIKVLQSSDSAEIVGAQVQILNLTQTSTLGLLTTNAEGCAVFALDNDTLLVRIYKPGWMFTVPETLKVSGDTDTTYYGALFDPGYPPAPELCRVYGWVKDINDLPVSGAKVQAKIDEIPLRYQSVLISPYYKKTTTDSDGYWYLNLFPNSILNPDTTSYIIIIYGSRGTILNLKTEVPSQGSWELSF